VRDKEERERETRKKLAEGVKGDRLILIFKFCGGTTSVRKRGLAIEKATKMGFMKKEREREREWPHITDS